MAPFRGNTICHLKFADPNSNENLLVFMSEGEVFCLDTVSENFIQNKDGSYLCTTIKKFSLVDIKQGFCVSVSEKGEGFMHKINI